MVKYIVVKIPERMLAKALGKCRRIGLKGQGVIGWRVSPLKFVPNTISTYKVEVEAYSVVYGAGAFVPKWTPERGGWITEYFSTPNPFLSRADILPDPSFAFEEEVEIEYQPT